MSQKKPFIQEQNKKRVSETDKDSEMLFVAAPSRIQSRSSAHCSNVTSCGWCWQLWRPATRLFAAELSQLPAASPRASTWFISLLRCRPPPLHHRPITRLLLLHLSGSFHWGAKDHLAPANTLLIPSISYLYSVGAPWSRRHIRSFWVYHVMLWLFVSF